MRGTVLAVGLMVTIFLAATPAVLRAQLAGRPFPTWAGKHSGGDPAPTPASQRVPGLDVSEGSAPSHAATGLLVGALVGAAATTFFLANFCGDPDTSCGADEVGRAVMVIALPCAAVGALLGSLANTEE